ncbi:molybdopterin synthase catalytic subunit [Kaistia algarum]|uniref:molybdenum cofactor biosynthesis protein MoaE n=1 Tax=Kaistia algarum TaxID=2083279 RepID=UPI000CE84058|nr:molybdenum cofactor biosynthesis protein MoaE [Kaistia algarum]MCX5511954.1 molybdenum cofactor biosynthesis protein MoaE [Kaistia algarum]PPE80086.1 molybdopterin synthase catalytic subunit [Kaistia algarum]
MATIRTAITAEPLDIAGEIEAIHRGRTDIGAVVSFTGLCRDEAGRLDALELEHYPGMAEREVGRIARQAAERWDVTALTVIHRHGKIRPGETIVLVVAASVHRHAAFEAAEFIMDFLKTHAPFWKKEHASDGTPLGWVAAKIADDDAEARWVAD